LRARANRSSGRVTPISSHALLRCYGEAMGKLIIVLLLAGIALFAWRIRRASRLVPLDRKDANDLPRPFAGVLITIFLVVFVILAFLVLPGLVERLP
jgi:hypothetical protein